MGDSGFESKMLSANNENCRTSWNPVAAGFRREGSKARRAELGEKYFAMPAFA